ncbi:Mitogen-activated protein kinase kinase kinase ANP1 [Pelomyxa schiedti]|nr:Mitogen-activated protein kinase kinase kinase ANP1 [Pelomyxa schiedti]
MVRLKCYLDNVIHVIHVSQGASEAFVVAQMCRVFGEPVTVYQYEDNDHEIVTVGTGSSWLEEAVLMYLHRKARKRKNDVSALRVYLKRTPTRNRAESDPAEFYRRTSTTSPWSLHRDFTREDRYPREGGTDIDPPIVTSDSRGDTRLANSPSPHSCQSSLKQQNFTQSRSQSPNAHSMPRAISSPSVSDRKNHHHHQHHHTQHTSKTHHSEKHHTSQPQSLLFQPQLPLSPPPLPLPSQSQSPAILQPPKQPQPQQPTQFPPTEVEYQRASTPQEQHNHRQFSLRSSLPAPLTLVSNSSYFTTESSQPQIQSLPIKLPHEGSNPHEIALGQTPLADTNKRARNPPDQFSIFRPGKSNPTDQVHDPFPSQIQSTFQPTPMHLSRQRTCAPTASYQSEDKLGSFPPAANYQRLHENFNPRKKKTHSKGSESSSGGELERKLSVYNSSNKNDYKESVKNDSSESESSEAQSSSNSEIQKSEEGEIEISSTTEGDTSSGTENEDEDTSESGQFDEESTPPEYTRTPPRLDPPVLRESSSRDAEKTPPSSPKHAAMSENSPVSPLPSPQPSPLPTPSLSPSPMSHSPPPIPFQLEVTSSVLPLEIRVDAPEIKVNYTVPKCTTTPQNWQKMQRVGRGGFGTVYLGMNKDTGEIFAVKQIEIENISDENAQQLLKSYDKEIQLMKKLVHPNIVKYLGATIDGLMLNIFMEYVGGGSLSSILSKFGPFSENMVRSYTKQLLQGLAYLHENNILHRDIKCANILLDTGVGRENVKLSDFGCSRNITDTIAQSQPNSVRGTPFWMAPEVMLANGHGPSADIWSLACTIVEMVTGKPPWSQQFPNPTQAMHFICNTTTPLHIPSHLSPQLQQLLDTCLQRDPTLRPTAQQLLKNPFLTMERVKSALSLSNLELSISPATSGVEMQGPTVSSTSVPSIQPSEPTSPQPRTHHTHTRQRSHSHQRQHSHSHQLDVMQLSFPKFSSPPLNPASPLSGDLGGQPASISVVSRPHFLLENLPPSVIVTILKFLTVSDLRHLPQVCRTWLQVFKDDNIWQLVCLDYWNTVIVKDKSWKNMFTNYVCNQHAWATKEIVPAVFKGHKKPITTLRCNGGMDPLIFTGSADKNIKIWDLNKRRRINTLHGHRGTVTCLDFITPEAAGYSLLSGSADKTIRLWYLDSRCKTKGLCQIVGKHKEIVTCLSVDGTRFVSGSKDRTLLLWDLQTATTISTLRGNTEASPLTVTFHGDLIASGYEDGVVRLWDPRTPTFHVVSSLRGHKGEVTSLNHVAGDNVLISGGNDGFIHRWDLKHLQCTKSFYSGAPVYSLSFDDVKIVSCGKDKVIKLWDVHSERCLRRLDGSALCVHSDTGAIYGGGSDKRLYVWALTPPKTPLSPTLSTSPTPTTVSAATSASTSAATTAPTSPSGTSTTSSGTPSQTSSSTTSLSNATPTTGGSGVLGLVVQSSPATRLSRLVPNLTGLLGKSSANKEEEREKGGSSVCKM